jgi:hypothetical protein
VVFSDFGKEGEVGSCILKWFVWTLVLNFRRGFCALNSEFPIFNSDAVFLVTDSGVVIQEIISIIAKVTIMPYFRESEGP